MADLDLVNVHAGLRREFGEEFMYRGETSATEYTYLLDAFGLPVHAGFFDNTNDELGRPSNFSIVTYPNEPKNVNHRLYLWQGIGQDFATLTELNEDYYLEGLDREPETISERKVFQPELDGLVRKLLLGTFVMGKNMGDVHDKYTRRIADKVEDVRRQGRSLIIHSSMYGFIDDTVLDRIAAKAPRAA